jgi:hypothetical protein
MQRSRPIAASLTGASVAIAAAHSPMGLAVVATTVLLMFSGVILPAVWSTKPARRRDARRVLRHLLQFLREPRPP